MSHSFGCNCPACNWNRSHPEHESDVTLRLARASYHDVVVYCDGQRYELGVDSPSLMLTCTRTGGWELWDCSERLIGGEFHNNQFSLEIAGVLVCGKKPEGI